MYECMYIERERESTKESKSMRERMREIESEKVSERDSRAFFVFVYKQD